MPRRVDSLTAYWFDERGALAGYPGQDEPTPDDWTPYKSREESLARSDARTTHREVKDQEGWKAPLLDQRDEWATLVFRDRLGFRWERYVGLNDDVSQVEAAKLLGVPLMRVNRWVRSGKLRSKPRRGKTGKPYSIIKVRHIVALAKELNIAVPRGRPLVIVSLADREDEDRQPANTGDSSEPTHKGGSRKRKRGAQKLAGRSARRSVGSARVRRGRRGE
jgi:hypothetical protein